MNNNLFEVEPGVYLSIADSHVSEARRDGDIITVNGIRFEKLLTDPRKWNQVSAMSQTQGQIPIKASMPGKIVRVLAKQGDKVEAGQGLVVMEAMKMQNELKTARAGVVTQIHVEEGATVEAGDLMVVVDSA